MARILATLIVGLLIGLLAAWWWLRGTPRTLAQPSDRLVAWIEVSSSEELPVTAGGTTWIIGCTLHLRNISGSDLQVAVPAQRFLVVLGDGSTVSGSLAAPATLTVGQQQGAALPLPKVSFFSRSQEAANAVIALDQGDGLRLVVAPVGEAPPQPEAEKKP